MFKDRHAFKDIPRENFGFSLRKVPNVRDEQLQRFTDCLPFPFPPEQGPSLLR